MNILILTVSAGAGHLKAAEAIRNKIKKRYPDSRTLVVDTYKYVNPIVDKLIVGSYIKTIKKTPKIYGKLYAMSEQRDSKYNFGKIVNRFLAVKLGSLIADFKPSIIVCTNFIPLQILSILNEKKALNIPTISVITDFTTHSYWLHEYVTAYVVAHDLLKYELIKKGIPGDIIYPYGIPFSSSFLLKKDKLKLLKEFKLEEKLTVLIMGGSLGFGELKKTFLSLLNYKKDIQLIVITGTNKELKLQLENCSLNTNKKVKIIGYTNRVADFMDISDLIITKPGGMTVTEALIKELPIVIISPIPGQEERNAHFLTNIGAAARILKDDDIGNILHQIIDNPLRVSHIKEMERFIARPNATDDTVNLIEKLSTKINDESSQSLIDIAKYTSLKGNLVYE